MITPLIELAARRTTQADAALKTDETTTLCFTAGRLSAARLSRSQGVNLRVLVDGRLGLAGSTGDDPADLLEAALSSARVGEPAAFTLPRPAPLPEVATHAPRAAAATLGDLTALGALVCDRLAGERADLTLELERSLGSVQVANTAGLAAAYDVTLVSLSLELCRDLDGRRLCFHARLSGMDLPTLPEVEQLVASLRRRLGWAGQAAEVSGGRHRVCFLPSALPLLLRPVEQALLGKAAMHGMSPLAERRGTRVFSESLNLRDDPLLPGRPGSRPLDDEGVPSRSLALVRGGTIEGLLYDLETASRVGAPPTGHGRRSTFAKPQPSPSNLVLEPGTATWPELLGAVGEGLLVEETRGVPTGNVVGGTFAQPASVVWRVSGGEVTGLVPEVTLAGNAHDLLGRVVALGAEPEWHGCRSAPALVVDGVSVY